MMNERQRQDYLAAMGIQPWFPRFVLPHALPPELCEWGEPIPEPVAEPQVKAITGSNPAPGQPARPQTYAPVHEFSGASPAAAREATSNILSSLQGDQKTKEPEKPQKKPEPVIAAEPVYQAAVTEPATPFRLTAISVSDDCLVVADMPWSGMNQYTSFHENLLRNILRALKIPARPQMRTSQFVWPMTPNLPATDRNHAKEAVAGFLNNQFGLPRYKQILLFGHNSSHYVWNDSLPFSESRGLQQSEDVQFAITCSLGEMLSLPALKADAWADLRQLLS